MNRFLCKIGQNNNKISEIEADALTNVLIIEKLIGFAAAQGEKIKEVSAIALTLRFDLIRMENFTHKQLWTQAGLND
ncbi:MULTISPECIES: hypothetical protein [unclassified Sporolactobacillus]|uniref:hypothetical protein n=1 Tax=unclassified Sporolactobacillus TaxID=2628533 RepID=UPI00236877C2|nr:hypothetical protein [Sporolactobacillus sp. CQH2019]MDD9147541.1 hypothetical protein [Sporolactobacillus sp. CQH2019]